MLHMHTAAPKSERMDGTLLMSKHKNTFKRTNETGIRNLYTHRHTHTRKANMSVSQYARAVVYIREWDIM